MKRSIDYKNNVKISSISKKPKRTFRSKTNIVNLDKWLELDQQVDRNSEWISATKTKNYLLKDPILDWLDKYYLKYGFGDQNIDRNKLNKDRVEINSEIELLTNTLFKKGNEFEKLIYDEIDKRIGKKNCVEVISNYKECCLEKVQDTVYYMSKGIPIIKQAVLYNESNKTFGIADLIIRSDYINKLFDDDISHINTDEINIGCKFSDSYHYRVIDIKWSQLQLCSDGFRILNTDRFPAYKGQLAIYNLALGKIQNYIPNIAYILGKSYKFEFKSDIYTSYNSFDRLGHILFDDFDNKYIEQTKKAIDWYREVLTDGSKWNILTDNRIELCPNMCNTCDSPYTKIKVELSAKKFELTSIWKVGVKNREIAFNNNVFNWMDENCSSKTLGISKNLSDTVDNIININKSTQDIFCPKKVTNNLFNWRDTKNYVDFFIDFETINNVFYKDTVSINDNSNTSYIFMIGVGYYDNNKWIFKEFHMDKLTNQEELRIMLDFKNYVKKVYKQQRKLSTSKIRFFHWSHAEISFLENFNSKNNYCYSDFIGNIEFADLYKLFTTEPICINGVTTYKLKDISNNLFNHGIIKANWKTSNVTNGLNAMLDGCYYYKCVDNNNIDKKAIDTFTQIINYNEVDCKVMGEILIWLRTYL